MDTLSRGAAWREVREIWTAATTLRNPLAVKWGGRLSLLLALALGVASLAGAPPPRGFWRGELLVAVGWLALVWMGSFLPASVLMNSAPNARLVPRLRRRLLQMGAGIWLAVTAGAALAFDSWAAFPLLAAYMLGLMLPRAGIRAAAALLFLVPLWLLASAQLPVPLLEAVTGTPGLLALSVLSLLAGAWGLLRLYPAGGDRHLDGRGQVVERIVRTQNPELARSRSPAWLDRLTYIPALQRDCLQARPGTMLLHALGPAVHWSALVPTLGMVLLLELGLYAVFALMGTPLSSDVTHGALNTTLAVLNVQIVLVSAKFARAMRTTQGEQALLRLTPLAGEAASLNRRLADAMTKAALLDWFMIALLLLAAGWVAGADTALLLRQFAVACAAAMLAAAGLLGDFARTLPAASWRQSLAVVVLGGGGAALQWTPLGNLFWACLALASLGAAAILLRVQRRRMLAAAPAFPVERIEAGVAAQELQR